MWMVGPGCGCALPSAAAAFALGLGLDAAETESDASRALPFPAPFFLSAFCRSRYTRVALSYTPGSQISYGHTLKLPLNVLGNVAELYQLQRFEDVGGGDAFVLL